jgi:hypothetical protein
LGLALVGLALGPAAPASASRQTAACAAKADHQGLSGAARRRFELKCHKGALAPSAPTVHAGRSLASTALVAPSGADRTQRSQQCNAEADRRGLKAGDYQAFRKSCIATAGPVSEAQTGTQTPMPASEKRALGTADAGKPH